MNISQVFYFNIDVCFFFQLRVVINKTAINILKMSFDAHIHAMLFDIYWEWNCRVIDQL